MQILTNFYTIIQQEQAEDKAVFSLRLNPAHPVYAGHFPGMPVVPGVCMLQIVKECVSMWTGNTVRYETVVSCKFLAVVNPEGEELFVISFTLKEGRLLQATATIGNIPVLKIKAILTAA